MGFPCPGRCGNLLTGRGRIPHGVLAIHDILDPFYIVGAEYVCTGEKCVAACGPEGRVFSSVDGSIMSALPPGLRREFPAHLLNAESDRGVQEDVWNWSVCGVSNGLWDLVQSALRIGTSPENTLELLHGTRDGVPNEVFAAPRQPTSPPESISAVVRPSASVNEAMEVEASLQESASTLLCCWSSCACSLRTQQPEVSISSGSLAPTSLGPTAFHLPVDENMNAPTLDLGRNEEDEEDPEPEALLETPAVPMSPNPSLEHAWQQAHVQQLFIPEHAVHPPVDPKPPIFQQPVAPVQIPPNMAFRFRPAQPMYSESTLASAVPYTSIAYVPGAQMTPVTAKRLFENPFPTHSGESSSPARRIRHCSKCSSGECKGKGGRSFCANPCQDCGRHECPGRNSKRPDKTCAEAWRPGETIT
jgi:hypothetical protein